MTTTKPTAHSTTLELIPKSTAETLDAHIRKIRTYIQGQRKGAAEQFGYAFLAGRVLLQAKNEVPNGNSKNPNAGFKHWVEQNFPDLGMRTAERWMVFAECITARVQIDAPKSPLLLGVSKLNVKTRSSILGFVREVMDGKGMMNFMRDCRLLRDPEKPKHTPAAPKSKQEANQARVEQARRVYKSLRADHQTALKVIKWCPLEDLQQTIDSLVDTANKLREQLKRLKGSAAQ